MAEKMKKSDAEWRKTLTPDQFYVTRQKGTEPPFTGEYEDTETPGIYRCVCCGQPLFRSETKFHSGSGWPSFWAPIDDNRVAPERDASHGVIRTEARSRIRRWPRSHRLTLLHQFGGAALGGKARGEIRRPR